MAKKKPKSNFDITLSKSPKRIEEPAKYKHIPISWQLSFIDDNSKWGIDVFKKRAILKKDFKFLYELNDTHNDVTNSIFDIAGKKFDSIDSLIEKINRDSKGNIKVEEIGIIIKNIEENIFWNEFYSKLSHFEQTTWNEIEKEQYGGKGKTKHHSVNISKIIPEAQKRLEVLLLDDIDELFSIRLTGKIRIWGIRKFSYLKVLWFDLDHEICPPQ